MELTTLPNKFLPLKIFPITRKPRPFPRGLSSQLLPFFKFSRYFARCPVKFESVPNKQQVNYQFKTCSAAFLTTLILAIFLNISLFIGILKYGGVANRDLVLAKDL